MSKKSNRFENLGLLEELKLKKLDVEQRLARTFVAVVNLGDTQYFITGGEDPPTHLSGKTFGCVCVGGSIADTMRGEDMLREIGSAISNIFSSRDLHATVIFDFLSQYLRAYLENMDIARGIAVEFMLIDSMGNVIGVKFTGDIETHNLDEEKIKVFIMGAYDSNFKKRLKADLMKSPDLREMNENKVKEFKEFADFLKKKYKLKHIGFII